MYVYVKDICVYVKETFNVHYTASGLTSWLKTHRFVYKKPKGRPFKANREQQEAFIKFYNDLMNTTLDDEPILFGDSVHPTQASKLSYGWIFKGEDHIIPTTGQKTRLNITAALNLETAHVFHQTYDQLSGQSFIDFLKELQKAYPNAPCIHLIVDQGPCHRSKEVKAYLKGADVRKKQEATWVLQLLVIHAVDIYGTIFERVAKLISMAECIVFSLPETTKNQDS